MRRQLWTTILLSLALVASALGAQASWRAGAFDQLDEPNTPPDTDPTLMWPTANQARVDRIYFDTIIDREGSSGVPWVRPDGTNFRGYGSTYFHAFLGYWRDCNRDGFVGDATTGATSYLYATADASLVDQLCDPATVYNDGVYVTELLPIGPDANAEDKDPVAAALRGAGVANLQGGANWVRDDFAKVWHDWGEPTDVPVESRLLLPFPSGTFDDTNGHFAYVDDLVFGKLSRHPDVGWLYPVAQDRTPKQCTPDNNGDGLTDDPVANAVQGLTTQACSPVPNVPNPVTATARDRYNDSSGACTKDCGTALARPWDEDCQLRSNPANWEIATGGSVDPTYDYTYRAALGDLQNNCGSTGASPWVANWRNLEIPNNQLGLTAKKATAQTLFSFFRDSFTNPSDAGGPDVDVCVPDQGVREAGESARIIGHPVCTGAWYSDGAWLRDTQYPLVEGRVAAAMVATFYADVNFGLPSQFADQAGRYNAPGALDDDPSALPGGDDPRAYGDHECSDGVSSTWSCDLAAWIEAAEIDPAAPNFDELVYLTPKVGDDVDLRDVECMDAEVAGTHLYEELAIASGNLVGDHRSCDDLRALTPLG